jgi:acyl carrier protein
MNDKINELIGNAFSIDGAAAKDSDSPQTIEAWDSVGHMLLLTSIEEELGIKFTQQDMESIRTIGQVRARVAELLK